jgi:hypothetical protein
METTDIFLTAFLILFFSYLIADLILARLQRDLYKERTHQLFLSNEIRRQMFVEKFKPQIRVTPPPWESQEFPTRDQVLQMSDAVRKGQGIGALFKKEVK